jgi:microcystin-dependent protein
MSSPYIGEIRIVPFGILPKGWAYCNGQLVSIQSNQPLFAILGTTYGGNGTSTFGLPNLQGRSPVHIGTPPTGGAAVALGEVSGEASHNLIAVEMPGHTHAMIASSAAASGGPSGALWAPHTSQDYTTPATSGMNAASIAFAGGSQPHENMSPYLVLNFIISLTGVFPSRN